MVFFFRSWRMRRRCGSESALKTVSIYLDECLNIIPASPNVKRSSQIFLSQSSNDERVGASSREKPHVSHLSSHSCMMFPSKRRALGAVAGTLLIGAAVLASGFGRKGIEPATLDAPWYGRSGYTDAMETRRVDVDTRYGQAVDSVNAMRTIVHKAKAAAANNASRSSSLPSGLSPYEQQALLRRGMHHGDVVVASQTETRSSAPSLQPAAPAPQAISSEAQRPSDSSPVGKDPGRKEPDKEHREPQEKQDSPPPSPSLSPIPAVVQEALRQWPAKGHHTHQEDN